MTKKKKAAAAEVPLSSRYTMISSGMGEHIAIKPGTEGKEADPWPPLSIHKAKSGNDTAVDTVIKKPKINGEQAAAIIIDEASDISVDKLGEFMESAKGSVDKIVLGALKQQLAEEAKEKFVSAVEAGSAVKIKSYGTYGGSMSTPIEDVYPMASEPVSLPYLGSPNPAPLEIGGGIIKGQAFEPDPYPQAAQTIPEPPPRNYLDDIIADRRGVDMLEMP